MKIYVNKTYILEDKIGNGAFGIIFLAKHHVTKRRVAIKIEENSNLSLLHHESKIYNYLRGIQGVPRIRTFGKEGNYNYMVIDVLGDSIEKYKNKQIHSIQKIGLQMIDIIRDVHEKGIIHRDVKPENILCQNGNLFFIDFGLAIPFMNEEQHIDNKINSSITGTLEFCSKFVNEYQYPSRRDDIYSILYILIYLNDGSLPWTGLKIISSVLEMKMNIINKRFKYLYSYIDSLDYDEKPNYEYIKKLINML